MPKRKQDNTVKHMLMTIGILFILGIATFLYLNGTFQTADEVNKAKQEMGLVEKTETNTTQNQGNNDQTKTDEDKFLENQQEFDKREQQAENEKLISVDIDYITDTKLLEFDDFSQEDITNLALEITGKTLDHVDKIVVIFSNKESKFPSSNYTLGKFDAGDESFLYRAFKKYESMDYGTNTYLVEAHGKDEVAKAEITIRVQKPVERIIDVETDKLPEGNDFGSPVDLGDGKVTYSDIKGLEIEKIGANDYMCEKNEETGQYRATEILNDRINGYYWWNSCRPVSGKEGMSYFVLKLDGTGYVYEKHYITPAGYYASYELETGDDLVGENDSAAAKEEKLKNKSSELKEQNDQYENIDIVDDLIKKL